MDKHKKDYSKGQIYCIRNNETNDLYIGSTCQTLSQRMAQHRLDMRRTNQQNRNLYKLMNQIGHEAFYIEQLEECPCENVYQLRKREGEVMRELKPTLNKVVNGRNKQEYYQDNKERIDNNRKQYYQEHKEYISINGIEKIMKKNKGTVV